MPIQPEQPPAGAGAAPEPAAGGAARHGGPPAAPRWTAARWVVPALVAVVLGSRIPAMALDSGLNPDECQLMAQVMRLGIAPLPWGGVDGTTSGPANTWLLFLAHGLGLPLEYRWVHALAALELAAITLLTYVALRAVTDRVVAAAGGGALALWIALAQGANFTHLGSELLPALLASAAFACITAGLSRPRLAGRLDPLAAVLLGLLPWAKLQAAPGAAALAAWLAWRLLRGAGRPGRVPLATRARRATLFVAAGLLPGALLLGIVGAGGAWRDFWASYVVANASYVGGADAAAIARRALRVLESPASAMLVGAAAFAALWLWSGAPGRRAADTPAGALVRAAAWYLVPTAIAVLTPQVPFQHYLVLLAAPAALLSAAVLGTWLAAGRSRRARALAGAAFAACLAGLPLTGLGAATRNARAVLELRGSPTPERRIARVVRAVAPGAKGLAIWGWMPCLFVETGIPPATRHAISHFLIDPSPARDHLRASFLADVRRERPDLFVDAVAPGCFVWRWNSSQRLPSFPGLADWVRRSYVLAAEEDLSGTHDPVRVYVSRDYLARAARPAAPLSGPAGPPAAARSRARRP